MLIEKRIGVVVPAFNEEKLIRKTLQGIPNFVDLMVVIDYKSEDNTANIIMECSHHDDRVILL